MLRSLFSLLLVALFISKLVYGLIWQVHYELNKAEITARYCENKNRPELHCNGQCYLAKQLQKADSALQAKEQEQQNHLDLGAKIISEQFYILNEAQFSVLQAPLVQAQKETLSKAAHYSYNYIQNCFHPPCIA
ncbi:MAG: hypothetical protein K9J18_04275 [Crocinitomicaceae bacterium]|nr:hypothetical protein [Crocinitomicaceae bacterium]